MADRPDLLGDLAAAIDAVCEADPALLADGESLVALHRQLERLEAATTRATAAFDAGGTWEADGARTAAAWVSTRCRLPVPAARRRVRLGRALRHMPVVAAAWLAGDIGAAHVAHLAEARTPATAECFARDEAMLVDHAGDTALPPVRADHGLLGPAGRSRRGRARRRGPAPQPPPAPVGRLRGDVVPRRAARSRRRDDRRRCAQAHREGAVRGRLGRGQGPGR